MARASRTVLKRVGFVMKGGRIVADASPAQLARGEGGADTVGARGQVRVGEDGDAAGVPDEGLVDGDRALDVVDDGAGNPVCRSVLDGTDANCLPFNVFNGQRVAGHTELPAGIIDIGAGHEVADLVGPAAEA